MYELDCVVRYQFLRNLEFRARALKLSLGLRSVLELAFMIDDCLLTSCIPKTKGLLWSNICLALRFTSSIRYVCMSNLV
jgi:hypothetical protein